MDQGTINLIGGAVMAALGWFARTLWDRQESLKDDLSQVKVMIAGGYVTNEKLNEVLAGLKEDLGYIRERMDAFPPSRRSGDHH